MNPTLDRLLSAYLDGALSSARRAAVEKRLAEPRVAKRLAQLKALQALLAESAAEPSAVQSRRMWLAIQAQLPAAAARQPWYAFLQRRWLSPVWGYGLAAGAVVAVALLLRPDAAQLKPMEEPSVKAVLPAPAPLERSLDAKAAAPAPAPAPARADRPSSAPKPQAVAASVPSKKSQTEVERALADDPVDGLIERFLRERPTAGAAASLGRASSPLGGGGANVAAYSMTEATEPAFDSSAIGQAEGGIDHNGFWNWSPAGAALNQRDWQKARIELEAAQGHAQEAAERAFAGSALTLLSAAGQPLQGTQPAIPATGDLRVLGAGVWQLQMDSRLARFSRGFSAHLPGFRVEGDSLLLDMTFDRGSFAPGTRFTRVGGEDPAKVLDAAAQPINADEFIAPAGAVYNVQDHELRLR